MKRNKDHNNGHWKLIFSLILILILYFVVDLTQNNFSFTNFNYNKNFGFFMKWIPYAEIQSHIWKLLLLLPAVIILTFLIVEKGITLTYPKNFSNNKIISIALLFVIAILIISSQFLFRETAVTDDEFTYDFEAQTLIAGRIFNPPPPVLENFNNVFIINDSKLWVGKYNLGHPLILAIGMLFGNKYILLIIFSALTLLLIYLITFELFNDKKLALLSFLLGLISPFFYFVSSSRLSHITSAFFLSLFMYLFLRSIRVKNLKYKFLFPIITGISLGYAFNVRPLTAVGFSFPFIFITLKEFKRDKKESFIPIIFMFSGFLIVFLLTLAYNKAITGNPFIFPFNYYATKEVLGFGTFGHNPIMGFKNFIIEFYRLNVSLFGFPISLLFVVIQFFYSKDIRDYFLFSIVLCFSLAYFFYYSPGVSDLGPVYYYELIIPLIILTSRGIISSIKLISKFYKKARSFVLIFLIFSIVFAWATYVPEKVIHIINLTKQIREPYEFIHSKGIHNAVVMINKIPKRGWVFGYSNPSPKLNDDIIYCKLADRESNIALTKHFNKRNFYILNFNQQSEKFELTPIDQLQE